MHEKVGIKIKAWDQGANKQKWPMHGLSPLSWQGHERESEVNRVHGLTDHKKIKIVEGGGEGAHTILL